MGQWVQTPEPYVKVQERIKKAELNPVAGDGLIIGCTIISDCGPSVPTLITSQKEFIKTYASQEVTENYIKSLNNLYADGGDLASTMWANAYRLSGSNSLLVTRASAAQGINFVKPLLSNGKTYIVKDGELLLKVNKEIQISLDPEGDEANHAIDGWAININGVGVIGNLNTDEGVQYDYYVDNLPDLIDQLNETSKFFAPKYTCYTSYLAEDNYVWSVWDGVDKSAVKAVVLNEVYLAAHILDEEGNDFVPGGLVNMMVSDPDFNNPSQHFISLSSITDFEPEEYFAINTYNSSSTLKVRIRKFNHDAVAERSLNPSQLKQLTENGESAYRVLTQVLDSFTKKGNKPVSASVKARDFFEVAIWDASISDSVSIFNVGNIPGRGDITTEELLSMLNMINLQIPDDLHDLGLNYWGYDADDCYWREVSEADVIKANAMEGLEALEDENGYITSLPELPTEVTYVGEVAKTSYVYGKYTRIVINKTPKTSDTTPDEIEYDYEYEYYVSAHSGKDQAWADVTIDPVESSILVVSEDGLKKAMDLIELDEVYVTEGLTDLGNTNPSFQNYVANIAINSNYFYPISTAKSTNYMTIGNFANKIPQDSYKLYLAAPWDIDTGTLGWKFFASPSVIYWEAVARNRRNNEEFRGVFGQNGGVVQYQRPMTEFNKKTRQLLLSKLVNTVSWNIQTQAWNMNDNVTKQVENTIMKDDGNSRLGIRISKAMPALLHPFIGNKISERMCTNIKNTIDYFFKTVILSMGFSVDGYQIFCEFDENLARQNKVKVIVKVRFARSLKYVDVVNNFYDVGMDISSSEE